MQQYLISAAADKTQKYIMNRIVVEQEHNAYELIRYVSLSINISSIIHPILGFTLSFRSLGLHQEYRTPGLYTLSTGDTGVDASVEIPS